MSNFLTICFDRNIECTNPRIQWLSSPGVLIECEDKNCVKIAPDPYADGEKCLEGWLHCDECDAKPIYFKKCFCTDKSDCEDCEICKQYGDYGLCEGILTEEQKRQGRLCNGDCPPDKPFFNGDLDKCVECREGTSNPDNPCLICIQGEWTIKCDNCDQSSGDCKQCLTNTDCANNTDGRNCCQPDGSCGCCPGNIWDPTQNKCIPAPDCNTINECKECEDCVQVQLEDGSFTKKCMPIKCPDGKICVPGKGCVDWKCLAVGCENGAECGPECGCVEIDGVKQCVPCELLECLGLCELALGCKCNQLSLKCEPLPNCNEDCDGTKPCTDPNCTCYQNTCVHCGNFPCNPDDCSGRYNCKCNDEEKCDGGAGCKDTLVINKKQDCSKADGCELEAVLAKNSKCDCDPIVTKVKHVPAGDACDQLNIETSFYKKEVPYKDYLTRIEIGDNEFINGTISAVIEHYVINFQGDLEKVTPPNLTNLTISKNIVNNQVNNIVINNNNYSKVFTYTGTQNNVTTTKALKTIVMVKIYAESIQIPNNKCTKYNRKQIAEFELNFNTDTVCNTISTLYTQYQIDDLRDTTSSKTPLFIWRKSVDSDSGIGKFDNTTKTYNKEGWFRKQYGVLKPGSTNTYVDSIKSPDEPDELWNNYNYEVAVDCGCAPKAFLDAVNFCCIDAEPVFENCNTKVTIPAFKVCDVSGDLSGLDKANYKIPAESQSKYNVIIATVNKSVITKELSFLNKNTIKEFTYTSLTEPIDSIRIVQIYSDGILAGEACAKDYPAQVIDLPNINMTTDCNYSENNIRVYTNQTTGANKRIQRINFVRGNGDTQTVLANYATEVNGLFSVILPKKINNVSIFPLKAQIIFTDGCVKFENVDSCDVSITLVPIGGKTISNKLCENGSGIDLLATPEFFDLSQPITYRLEGGDLQVPQEVTNTNGSASFTNLGGGTYIGTATQGTIVATTEYIVPEAIEPVVTLAPATICQNQTASITIQAVQGTGFTIINPMGSVIASPVIGVTGEFTLPNLNMEGEYLVSMTLDPNNVYCSPFVSSNVLSVGGQNLTPTIELQPGTYCVGQPIPFRIVDGGANATYNLTTNGSGLITTPLQANLYNYNGTYTPNAANGIIKITGVTDSCNQTTQPQINVNSQLAPVISNPQGICQPDNTHTVDVTVSGASSVTVEGVAATNVSGNLWRRTGVTGLTEVEIIASNGTCESSTSLTLQNCLCPSGTVTIYSSGDTCGQGSATINYNGSTLGINNTWQYAFQKNVGGEYIDIQTIQTFPLVPATVNISVNTTIGTLDFYRIKVINPANNCTYYSEPVSVTAVQPPVGVTIFPSVPVPVQAGTSIYFTTQAGYDSYQWGGAVSGTTNQSSTIIINEAGNYQVSVIVYSSPTCFETVTYDFEVVQNCNPAIVIGSPTSFGCGDIFISVVGGNGAKTYTATGTYITVSSTPVPNNGTIILDGSLVPIGETDNITLTVTDANGCEAIASIPYTRCGTDTLILNLSTAGTWRTGGNSTYTLQQIIDFPSSEFIFLTDIRFVRPNNTEAILWSGPTQPPVPSNGTEEFILYHDRTATGCVGGTDEDKDLALVNAWFPPASRTLITDLTALAASVEANMLDPGRGGEFTGCTVTVVGDTLVFSNIGCKVKELRGTIYWGSSSDCSFDNLTKQPSMTQFVVNNCYVSN